MSALESAWSHLTAALAQQSPSDDPIIMEHVADAERILRGELFGRACPRCTYRGREQRCPRDGERTIRGEIADAVDAALAGVRRAA